MRDLVPLSDIVERVKDKNAGLTDLVFTVSAEHGLVDQEAYFTKRVASRNLAGYTLVSPGDFVYNKSYSAAAPLGMIARNDSESIGVVSPLYIVFRCVSPQIVDGYLELAVRSSEFADSIKGLIKEGGRAHGGINISLADFFSALVPLPSLAEQRRIVDLIAAVDENIAAADALVDSAQTARTSVLSELLGAGDDDWAETTLGKVASFINGYPFKPAELNGEGLPVIRIKQLLDPQEIPDRSDVAVPERCLLSDGDLVFSWSGTLAVRIWDRGPAVLNQHLFRVVEADGVDRAWLAFALDHAIHDLEKKTHGSTMKHITKGSLLPHEVLLPPLAEQRRIVDLMSAVDDELAAARGLSGALRATRASLLADLLSGDHEIPKSYDRLLEAS